MPELDSEFISNQLARCNRCGYCIRTCPTYRATGHEGAVARSRNDLVRAVQRGKSELLEEMGDRFFQCLLCGACTESCLTDVQTDEIMVEAREAYRQAHGDSWLQQFIFRELLPDPERLAKYARLVALGKNTGISGLARSLGLLKIVSPKLDNAEALVEHMPREFFRDQLPHLGFHPVEDRPRGWFRYRPARVTGLRLLYFVGCGSNFQVPGEVVAGVRLLQAGGCDITVAPNVCCGLPPYSYGDREAARLLAAANLETLGSADCDVLLTECGSCSSFLKHYPRLLEGTEAAEPAQALAGKVRDITEVLPDLTLPEPRPLSHRVTYHDPCHLGRKQKIKAQPRDLLKRIPGVEHIELPEADWCCGGAGSYNLSNPDLSRKVLARKVENVRETGADTLITSCPACVIQLASGMREAGLDIQVRHLCDFLAEAHLPPDDAPC
ncbi:MAG: (Fe-S)-binding protein [Armatimonadetes bacterium]|nr:(Fe-S)-binding protein [Armatimonadota bacterium]